MILNLKVKIALQGFTNINIVNGCLKVKLKYNLISRNFSFNCNFMNTFFHFRVFTLYPGDVILTGTPSGVGMHRNPPEYLKKGDILETEIEGIGRLRNVIA